MIRNSNYFEMVRSSTLVDQFFLPTDLLLLYLPLAHNFGRYMHLLGAHIGFTIAFCPDPRRLAEVMPAVRPTIMPTVPRVLEKVHTGVTANFTAGDGRQAAADRLGAPRRPTGSASSARPASRSRPVSPRSTGSPTSSSTRR